MGRKVFIWLTLHCSSFIKEWELIKGRNSNFIRTEIQSGQDFEVGADVEATEKCCLLACSKSTFL